MNILIAFGTRPEWLKIKPLVNQFKINGINHKLFFTGQHIDLLKDINVDFKLEQKDMCSNRLNSIIANTITCNLPIDFSHVLVQGDTSSAFAMALWAFNNKIKIIHLEAGLRTYDLNHPYPEEANRQLISRIADIHLCATINNKMSLCNEKIPNNNNNIHIVGNTVLDNIAEITPTYGNKVLVTLHRRENHDIIDKWFFEIDNIAKKYNYLDFILPIHPNPNVLKHKNIFKHVRVVDPLNHEELINILKDCRFVITDSGGIQEEASFLNKRIIICRETTEREECLDNHGILCMSPSDLNSHVKSIINNYEVNAPCPFGNGTSSQIIAKILKTL
jgi:UDP-N-acetylglucosamine 2-epimerase (non-hydrolysing)